MSDPRDHAVDEIMRRGAERRFEAWLGHLRSGDLRFAEASALQPDTKGEWQAAVYLLTGCDHVWKRLGGQVLADASLGCVAEALETEEDWSFTEAAVMRWSAHFADGRANDAGGYPSVFDEFHFRRWVTAVHLRNALAPAMTIIDERRI
jgi:hypothetical protein